MDTNRIPKQALQYKTKGQRNIGRPGRDGGTNFIWRIKEQETRLTLQENDDDDMLNNHCHRVTAQLQLINIIIIIIIINGILRLP
jgi:hypothetical protein